MSPKVSLSNNHSHHHKIADTYRVITTCYFKYFSWMNDFNNPMKQMLLLPLIRRQGNWGPGRLTFPRSCRQQMAGILFESRWVWLQSPYFKKKTFLCYFIILLSVGNSAVYFFKSEKMIFQCLQSNGSKDLGFRRILKFKRILADIFLPPLSFNKKDL